MSKAKDLAGLVSTGGILADGTISLTTEVTGTLPVANGGTNATTADGALTALGGTTVGTGVFKAVDAAAGRTTLGAASSGANSDITSLTGLTTALSVAQGGTGLTTVGTNGQVLQSNGSALVFATPGGGFDTMSVITSSSTFTIPSGKTAVKVTVVGGGGGSDSGTTGGTSSVASGTQTISTISATGGTGGTGFYAPGAGGVGSGGTLNFNGNGGGGGGNAAYIPGGTGGGSFFGGGGSGGHAGYQQAGTAYGGGGGAGRNPSDQGLAAGGGGGCAMKYLTGLTPGNTLSITIGAGGTAGGSGGTAGFAGVVVIEY